tara:strand:+ start:2410 stop:3066 length:657 start_codon:yes stop_codon:yes gene_type:complete
MSLQQIVNGHLKNTFNKNNLTLLGVGLLIGALVMFMFQKPTIIEVPVPIKIEVAVPVVQNEFTPIVTPEPSIKYIKGDIITKIDSAYYNKYITLKDSISKDSAYKSAITIREYNTKFEDDILTLNIYSKIRGDLLEIKPDYKTKPRSIRLDTTIYVPVPKYNEFYGGFEIGAPTNTDSPISVLPTLSAKGYLKTKKDKLWSAGFDTRGYVSVGFAWKF